MKEVVSPCPRPVLSAHSIGMVTTQEWRQLPAFVHSPASPHLREKPQCGQQHHAQGPAALATLLSPPMPVSLSKDDVRMNNLRRGAQRALVPPSRQLALRAGCRRLA